MRAPCPGFRRQSGPPRRVLTPPLEHAEGVARVHPRPDRPWRAALLEGADAANRQIEWGAGDRLEFRIQVVRLPFGDLPGEAEGQMHILGRTPARAGHAVLQACQPLGLRRWNGDGGEEPDHRPPLDLSARATAGARRWAMTAAPAALGWIPSRWISPGWP